MREAAGRITGYALGEDHDTDVLTIFGMDEKLWCETIAERLRGSIPEAYTDITQDAVASQLRALGVTVKSVREPGKGPVPVRAQRRPCRRGGRRCVAESPNRVVLARQLGHLRKREMPLHAKTCGFSVGMLK
jgi:hypothetical protein